MAMGELQATAAGIVAEVRSLGVVVQANTAAIQTEGCQNRRLQRQNNARQRHLQRQIVS